MKDPPGYVERGDFALSMVRLLDELRRLGVGVNIDLLEGQLPFPQELPGATAIRAPGGGVHADGGGHIEDLSAFRVTISTRKMASATFILDFLALTLGAQPDLSFQVNFTANTPAASMHFPEIQTGPHSSASA